MRRSLLLVPVALASAHPAGAQSWSWETMAGVASEYRDRGWDLSAGRPSAYGEFTAYHSSGAYGGVWAADIADYEGAGVELTGYVGWAGAVGGWDVDVAVWQNVYPDGVDVDYVEFPVQVGRTFGAVGLDAFRLGARGVAPVLSCPRGPRGRRVCARRQDRLAGRGRGAGGPRLQHRR
jgi:hypothetical protein